MSSLGVSQLLKKEGRSGKPGTIGIDDIKISLDEISAKETSFEDKFVPATEIVDGREFEVACSIIIIRKSKNTTERTVIENKYIRGTQQVFADS